jgi:hypothetical protein
MFGIGAPELIILFVILIGVALVRRQSGRIGISGPTLVLRKFSVIETTPNGYFVDIVGRASGLTAWLLTVMRFDTETSLKVSKKDISFKSSSLFGQIHQVSPLPSISSTHCGYSRPISFLILGIIFIFISLYNYMFRSYAMGAEFLPIINLIIGVLFFIAYWLSKKMALSIQTKGGVTMGLIFKRSVIENVAVDIQKAIQAISIINKNVIESQKLKIQLRPKASPKPQPS